MAGMREEMRSRARLARLAEKQYGVVSSRQLRHLGFSQSAIARHAAASTLLRIHRGVYAVGRADLTDHGRCMAAILACGRETVLSHGSAAWLWGFSANLPPLITVTVPAGRVRRRPRIAVHRRDLPAEEHGRLERLPVTSAPRLLLDLAATSPEWKLGQAIDRAERLGRLDLIAIDALLGRWQGARGTKRLRDALDLYWDPVFNRAKSERLFLAIVKKANLPRPAMNTYVAGHEIDAYWAAERFAVEVDGWDSHRTRKAFESDPLRQEELKLAGIDSIRVTARRIEREPSQVGRRLGTLLANRRKELGRPAG